MRIIRICFGILLLIIAVFFIFTSFISYGNMNESRNFPLWTLNLLFSLILITFSLKLFSKPEKITIDSDGVIYAGLGLRIQAGIIDGIILMGFYFLTRPIENYSFVFYATFTYLWAIAAHVFTILFLTKFGATPGKLAMKVKVVKTSLEPISFKEAFLRSSVNILQSLIYFIVISIVFKSFSYETYRLMSFAEKGKYIAEFYPDWFNYNGIFNALWMWIGLIMILFHKKRRVPHDFIAGTVVIVRPDAYKRYGFTQAENK